MGTRGGETRDMGNTGLTAVTFSAQSHENRFTVKNGQMTGSYFN